MSNLQWTTVTEASDLPPVTGERKGAEIRIDVRLNDDGEREYYTECMCAACSLIAETGLPDAIADRGLPVGVHYMKSHVEEYQGIPGVSSTEYDWWLIHTLKGETE